MNRRRFLELAACSSSLIAGCVSDPGQPSETESSTESPTDVHTPTSTIPTSTPDTPSETEDPTPTRTETDSPTATPRDKPDTIFVSPDGSNSDEGTVDSPIRTIQEGLRRAGPGETVNVSPGQYFENLNTIRDGKPGQPITIEGSPEAIISGEKNQNWTKAFGVDHSHIHIKGITIDGLQDPANPDDVSSYINIGIHTNPNSERVLDNLLYKPSRIGNTREAAITLGPANNVEIGEFRVIGPVGLEYLMGEEIGHFGELVYFGTGEVSETENNNVHIHHIDNSDGHDHIEFIDTKGGTSNVTVEYCTSVNAQLPSDNDNGSAVHLGGKDLTFRWNRIESSAFNAIDVGNYAPYNEDYPNEAAPDAGRNNSIYGNALLGSGEKAINYTGETSEAEQKIVCGNEVNTDTEGEPSKECPESIPITETTGHLGGDSPWT